MARSDFRVTIFDSFGRCVVRSCWAPAPLLEAPRFSRRGSWEVMTGDGIQMILYQPYIALPSPSISLPQFSLFLAV